MTTADLKKAIHEAERFLERAKDLDQKCPSSINWWRFPKETGAVKRASMDLPRSLADLRRTR